MQYGYDENDDNNMNDETKRETSLRGAHDALSSHIARTLVHLVMSLHTSLVQELSKHFVIDGHIHRRTLLESLLCFYFNLFFLVFFFSFHFLHSDLYP